VHLTLQMTCATVKHWCTSLFVHSCHSHTAACVMITHAMVKVSQDFGHLVLWTCLYSVFLSLAYLYKQSKIMRKHTVN